MNLFIELHEARFGSAERRFGTGWENLFTEQLAFFLSADLMAATHLVRLFLAGREETVVGVSTQARLDLGRPDLRVQLGSGACVHVEHKFDAPLGPEQLERYLREGPVALVSRCSQTVSTEVLANGNYLCPSDRHYFNWADIYNALPPGSAAPDGFGALREHFRGYMRELGLAPTFLPSEWRRLFEDRTDPANQPVQKDFGRLLDAVKAALKDQGLRVIDVSHMGKQASAPSGAWWRHLYVKPSLVRADYLRSSDVGAFDPGFEGLLVELVCDGSEVQRAGAVYGAIRDGFDDSCGRRWFAVKPRSIAGSGRLRIALATPLVPLLKSQQLSATLTASTVQALDHLLSAAERS